MFRRIIPVRRSRSHPAASLRLAAVLSVLAVTMLGAVDVRAQAPDLKPQGYINDFAGALSAPAKQRLEALCTELNQKTKAQLAVVTINSLNGEPIEDYSVSLATRWGIGSKKAGDTGVLLLLAIQDRLSRIEVGYGLEPILPDGKVGSILREMRPALRQGDYDSAVSQAVGEMAGIIAQASGVTLSAPLPQPARRPPQQKGSPFGALVWLLLLFGLPILLFPRRRRAGWYGSGSGTGYIIAGLLGYFLGGGRGGFFGGGGGGFGSSGGFGGFGGGGFGGGGASSSW
jgi:uncharacterized protein